MHFTTSFVALLAAGAMANAVPEAAVDVGPAFEVQIRHSTNPFQDVNIAARNAEAEPGIMAALGLAKGAKAVSAFSASGKALQAAGNVAPAKIATTVGNAQTLRLGKALPAFKGIPIGSVRTRPGKREAEAEAEPGIMAALGLAKGAKAVSAFSASGKALQAAGNVAPAKIATTVGNAQTLRLGNALPAFKGIPIGSVRTRPGRREAGPEAAAEPGIMAALGLAKGAKAVSAFSASGKALQAAGNVAPAKIATTVGNAQTLRLGNALPAFKGIPIGSVRTRPGRREADAEPEAVVAMAFRA